MTQTTCPFGPGYDFTDPDVLLQGIPVAEFAELRKTAPVWWNEQPESIFGDGGGYWVISRHGPSRATATSGRPTARASSCGCPTAPHPISWS
jgi:cholest-4-en-3-one 26-monooxygenase